VRTLTLALLALVLVLAVGVLSLAEGVARTLAVEGE
jgi:hypothetical protein